MSEKERDSNPYHPSSETSGNNSQSSNNSSSLSVIQMVCMGIGLVSMMGLQRVLGYEGIMVSALFGGIGGGVGGGIGAIIDAAMKPKR